MSASADETGAARLSLTDFLDLPTIQNLQDGFAALTRLSTVFRDSAGRKLLEPTDPAARRASDRVLDFLLVDENDGQGFVAPIVVEGMELGSIEVRPQEDGGLETATRQQLREAATRMGVEAGKIEQMLDAAERAMTPSRAAAVQFLYLLANHITRLCYQEHQLRRRVEELGSLYRFSTMLASQRELQQVLDAAAQSAATMLGSKAVAIRLLDGETQELVCRSVWGLSRAMLEKGTVLPRRSTTYAKALAGEPAYLAEVWSDPRIMTAEEAREQGVTSLLCLGLMHQGRAFGVIQWFTGEARRFTAGQVDLGRALAQLVTSAVVNARLDQQQTQRQDVQRQLRLAAQVQQRMLPDTVPSIPPLQIAARYVPSYELGGDFYDLLDLDGNLGVAVGDVVGKGVAASLLTASVRASIRAFAQDVYDLDQIIARVNMALARDTRDSEFVTLFYGVLDPKKLRLTYCNAGHDPPLLLRDGKLTALETGGMVLGIDAAQTYQKGILDLRAGDLLAIYTDGLIDAMDRGGKKFGRARMKQAFLETGGMNAADAMHHLLWSMRRHIGLARNVDDTTLVVVRVGQAAGK
ncbi:MAG: SpoIIE family protein phosphatase [Phycisphaeraceae bacterium]|nr:SpoIIE family protein phosphatase [Phycisphaeraceae bacterium]